MTATARLLAVFRVEKQLQGLQSRLKAAERFLGAQEKQLDASRAKIESLRSQQRQLQATSMERESEVKRLDARIEELRERMNTAQTNKEYQAVLVEVNTLKDDRGEAESQALEALQEVEAIGAQVAESEADVAKREGVVKHAGEQRDERAAEIKGRVEELRAERSKLADEVPAEALRQLEALVTERGDEAMVPVEIIDRRRHEANCGGCMMTVPVETLSSLLRGEMTMCPNCRALMFIEEDVAARFQPASTKR